MVESLRCMMGWKFEFSKNIFKKWEFYCVLILIIWYFREKNANFFYINMRTLYCCFSYFRGHVHLKIKEYHSLTTWPHAVERQVFIGFFSVVFFCLFVCFVFCMLQITYFRCLGEYCSAVLLWSTKNVFVDYKSSTDFPSAWGWVDNDWILIFGCKNSS